MCLLSISLTWKHAGSCCKDFRTIFSEAVWVNFHVTRPVSCAVKQGLDEKARSAEGPSGSNRMATQSISSIECSDCHVNPGNRAEE